MAYQIISTGYITKFLNWEELKWFQRGVLLVSLRQPKITIRAFDDIY